MSCGCVTSTPTKRCTWRRRCLIAIMTGGQRPPTAAATQPTTIRIQISPAFNVSMPTATMNSAMQGWEGLRAEVAASCPGWIVYRPRQSVRGELELEWLACFANAYAHVGLAKKPDESNSGWPTATYLSRICNEPCCGLTHVPASLLICTPINLDEWIARAGRSCSQLRWLTEWQAVWSLRSRTSRRGRSNTVKPLHR